ncbi:CHAT domain-containing protein [Bisporella sp. PMI_857]|nr:CHAT domain-containing protein [Bisporella sp. PMI_857]
MKAHDLQNGEGHALHLLRLQQYQEALDNSSSLINDRLEPGRAMLKLHAYAKNWPEACQTASKVVALVPLLTHRSLEASDRQRLLINVSEIGREVIAGSINEIRADISELHKHYPVLAKEYINLRNQLDAPKPLIERQVDQRIAAGQKLEKKIKRIRTLPGFGRFLFAPSEDELMTAAENGPIVVINVSEYRCDALIVEKSQLRSLELPRLRTSDIQDHMTESLATPKMLEWLWEAVVQPVLDTLGFTKAPSDGCWPRIWWIPTGSLSKFPLHAAGYHTNCSAETVLDRVMSSYSSSIKAIIHGRSQQRGAEDTTSNPAKALLVAIENTPGSPRLPFVTKEVKMLHDLCRSMMLESIEPGRRKQDVMSHLPHCSLFHFAGHGYTSDKDPLESYLLLEDGKSDALTVANLLELNLRERSPFLAYLSACGTGRIEGDKFVDENIHLISAC